MFSEVGCLNEEVHGLRNGIGPGFRCIPESASSGDWKQAGNHRHIHTLVLAAL